MALHITRRERRRKNGTIAYTARLRSGTTETTRTFNTARSRERFIRRADALGIDRALAELDQPGGTHASQGAPTLHDWAHTCINERDLAEGTARPYRAYTNDLHKLADLPLDTITPDDIRTWITWLRDSKGNGPKTIANKHGFIYSILSDAVHAGHITENPCSNTRLPKPAHHEMICLEPWQASTIINLTHPHLQPFVRLLVTTGLRYGEAAALTPAAVNQTARTVRVLEALTRAEKGWEVGPPKTPHSVRTVPLTDEVLADLRPRLLRPPRDPLFTSLTGQALLHDGFFTRHWKPIIKLANGVEVGKGDRGAEYYRSVKPAVVPIGVRPRIHDLRHTAASWWLAAGVDIYIVKARLGHKSITTTVDTYGHLLPGAHDKARAGMATMAGLLA